MKATNRLLALLLLALCAIMCACAAPVTPEAIARQERAVKLGDRLLAWGVRKAIVSKEDAAFLREVGTIVITPPAPKPEPPAIETTSGK
jgi:hypothetical protein